MKTLSLFNLDAVDQLVQPTDFTETSLNSPALSVLSDFKHNQPTMIEGNTSATQALQMMQLEHCQLKLVVDADERMLGLIHIEQLSEQALLRQVIQGIYCSKAPHQPDSNSNNNRAVNIFYSPSC